MTRTKTAAAPKPSRTRMPKQGDAASSPPARMEESGATCPAPVAAAVPDAPAAPTGKLGTLVALLRRQEGVTLADMQAATGWQAHSVRGAIAGSLKKKQGFTVLSSKSDGGPRVYRIAP